MDVFVLMGERQSCEDEDGQMDVFVLMGQLCLSPINTNTSI